MTAAHLRIYTINKGFIESWLTMFHEELIPIMEDAGMKVESSWVNLDKSQFIWIRSYGDSFENYDTMTAAYKGCDWWKANVDIVKKHIAHMEVIEIQSS